MKIKAHDEIHIVELDDGTVWKIFPGDIDITLHWKPETQLKLIAIDDEISSYALISDDDPGRARVLPMGQEWPLTIKMILGKINRRKRNTGY